MKNTITYKDYVGTVNFSEEDMFFSVRLSGLQIQFRLKAIL